MLSVTLETLLKLIFRKSDVYVEFGSKKDLGIGYSVSTWCRQDWKETELYLLGSFIHVYISTPIEDTQCNHKEYQNGVRGQ